MIKIDFHIHSVSSSVDSAFEFSIDKIIEYVKEKKINAIAITNHNLFDKTNFELIRTGVSIPVYPGIEITLESGHILLISNNVDIDDFNTKCSKIKNEFDINKNITFEFLESTFGDLSNYLLIPHYDKKPKIPSATLDKLGFNFYCGEVANSKKFVRLQKDNKSITPLFFSDMRMSNESKLSAQQTYVDVDNVDFGTIKEALRDKNKVYLNKFKKKDLFPILDDGTLASTGVNLIFGKRSTGKTHTLDCIYDNFVDVKYIRQFELIESNKEKAEQEFDSEIAKQRTLFADDYLKEFKEAVKSACLLNFHDFEIAADSYVMSLLAFAIDSDKLDSFAKVPIFSEQDFEFTKDQKIVKLIDSVIELMNADVYSSIVEKYISKDRLFELLCELNDKYIENRTMDLKCRVSNELIVQIKKDLSIESSQDSVKSFNVTEYTKQVIEKRCFESVCKVIETSKEIQNQPVGRFNVVACRNPIASASDLQRIVSRQGEYRSSFDLYNHPFEYLKSLKSKSYISDDILYKCFVQIDYRVLNENGYPVSGGERAEFNLENKLADAENYEMLLIDEPESSFDNIFLRKDISTKLFELSKKMPVFVSTHNSVIGGSLNSNYILYTNMSRNDDGKPVFSIYGGLRETKQLADIAGNTTDNYFVLMDCLEGGEDSYGERNQSYKNLKN